MTYAELECYISSMTEEQKGNDVSIAILSDCNQGVEIVGLTDFVNPEVIDPDDEDYKEAVYLDEINGSILDEGHCYITMVLF